MLTDEIMDHIEMKAGFPKKQQRITHQSKQLTTRQTLNHQNIRENDVVDLSLELQGGTATTDPTEQRTMDTEETTTHNDAQTTEREPIKRRASGRSRSRRRTRTSSRGHHSRATQKTTW